MNAENDTMERIVAEIPSHLKRLAAAKAALEGRSLKDVLVKLLEQWVNEKKESNHISS